MKIDNVVPTSENMAHHFSFWPGEFHKQLTVLQTELPLRSTGSLEYLSRLVPLLNVEWEIFYSLASLQNNSTISMFYNTTFNVLRYAGARMDWASHDRPWQMKSEIKERDRSRRVVSLHYHLTKPPDRRSWIYKEASLPGYVHFDRLGYAGWSTLGVEGYRVRDYVTKSEADDFFTDLTCRYIDKDESKFAQSKESFDRSDYLFFPLQLIDDSVQKLARISMLELSKALVNAASTIECDVVFKRHPLCSSRDVAAFLQWAETNPRVFVSNASIHTLIRRSQAVITVNSGVGFEALLHMKHVFLGGKADYEAACHRILSIDDIPGLANTIRSAVDSDKIKQFLYYALNAHQCRASDQDHVAAHLIRTLYVNPR